MSMRWGLQVSRQRGKLVAYGVLGLMAAGAVLVVWLLAQGQEPLHVDEILAAYAEGQEPSALSIRYPFDGTLFPPEIAPATFQWEDPTTADAWLVVLEFEDGRGRMTFARGDREWTPSAQQWESIKRRSREREAKVTILGVRRARQKTLLSAASIAVRTSPDEVGAPVFYREVNLPFKEAVRDPSQIRWRCGEISSSQQPPIVLERLPVCGNCHSFSADGGVMGLDVDYANDKASYAILPVAQEMTLEAGKIITWNDYRRDDREPTFGLLSQVSPDGRYVISTVKDRSVFVAREDLAYSQLFFPIKGVLAVYDRKTRKFQALPGADDPQYVQSNPSWSPDGKYVVFARCKAYRLRNEPRNAAVLLTAEECEEFLQGGKTFLFDLYRVPFNGGQGGKAAPLAGASRNGMSNYFAKYSPDGKWIVFCQAKSFMLLQPDSRLYILPAEGGRARPLACNLAGMNSWHSWSPNGKWLVFSSKAFTPYTQLFLTHIDAEGRDSPAVLLAQFTAPDRAANIPEFVNIAPGGIRRIHEQFVDDYSYVKITAARVQLGDLDGAEQAARKALEINPNSAEALNNLALVVAERGRPDEAQNYLTQAIRADPKHWRPRLNLGHLLSRQGKLQESLPHYREALKIDPELFDAHLLLGISLLDLDKPLEAAGHLGAAVRLRPEDPQAHCYLGTALHRQGNLEQAAIHYAAALEQKPDYVPALSALAMIYATAKQPELRDVTQAIKFGERACALTRYEEAQPLAILAAAYAQAGRYREATGTALRALNLAQRAGNKELAQAIEQRLQQYRQRLAVPPGPP